VYSFNAGTILAADGILVRHGAFVATLFVYLSCLSKSRPCSMLLATVSSRFYLQIQGNDVHCDESALTGESEEQSKSPATAPFMLSGTAVTKGTGTMIVTCVGLFSEEGIIQKLITGLGKEEASI
jgi:hypothetical protein